MIPRWEGAAAEGELLDRKGTLAAPRFINCAHHFIHPERFSEVDTGNAIETRNRTMDPRCRPRLFPLLTVIDLGHASVFLLRVTIYRRGHELPSE